MSVYIGSPFGHFSLDSWTMAKIIQIATMDFCRRYLRQNNDPCGRQFDQTTQAARSVAANIAEGTARYSTSKETELRLLDVARGSLAEVMDDFMFFIIDNKQSLWTNEDPNAYSIRGIRLDTPNLGKSMMYDTGEHIKTQKIKFDYWLENPDMMVRANAIVVLCLRLLKMLRNQMESILQRFEKEGGFSENMTDSRLKAKKEQSIEQGAPKCPICGAEMTKCTTKKGVHSGKQFWGCVNFRTNGCKGLIPID